MDALLVAAAIAAALVALEIGQRLSDRRKLARRVRTLPPYTYRTVSARGVPLTDKPGAVALRLHPCLVYRAVPNQRFEGLAVNGQGYRGREWRREKPPGTRRVIVLGDSMGFGYGMVGDGKLFPAVLETYLGAVAPEGASVEVLNGSVLGYNSTQSLVQLATDVLDHAPDAILIFNGLCDFCASRLEEMDGVPVNPVCDRVDELIEETRHPIRAALRLSAAFRALERRFAGLKASAADFADLRAAPGRDHARGAARYRANLERMSALAQAVGAGVVIAVEPEMFRRAAPVPEAEEAIRRKKGQGGYREAVLADYPRYIRAAEEASREAGAEVVDLSSAFDGLPGVVYHDWLHLNERGHEIVARRLVPAVARACGFAAAGAPVAPLAVAPGRPG